MARCKLPVSMKGFGDHAELTDAQRAELLALIGLLHQQGEDWDGWFEAVPGTTNHNVNVAQGLKSAAVLSRFNSSATVAGGSPGHKSEARRTGDSGHTPLA